MSVKINLTLPKKYAAQKIINLVTIGLMFGVIIWSVFFVYQYAYQTIDNVNNIILLNTDMGVNLIDLKAYDLSQKNLEIKKNIGSLPTEIRNIFYYVEPTNITKTTTKPKK